MTGDELIRLLEERSGLTASEIRRIIETAPKRYKQYQIRKRSGGWRQIAQPARELKALQRIILYEIFSAYPVHSSAMAYEEGRSISHNASAHVGARALLKLDFQEFFPSIRRKDWLRLSKKINPLQISKDGLNIISRLIFWGAGVNYPYFLSIGAPTSPKVSNIILYDLDCTLFELSKKFGVKYTRYADDITVSSNDTAALLYFENETRRIIHKMKSPVLQFNEDKRGLYHVGQKMLVTGLVITPQNVVSIGRERKRLISAIVHKAAIGEITPEQLAQGKGLIAFAIAAEPDFVGRLRRKYGDEVVNRIMRYEIPRKVDLP